MELITIPPSILALIQILGLPGLIFVIWYGSVSKDRRTEQKRDELMNVISLNSQAFTRLDSSLKQKVGGAG